MNEWQSRTGILVGEAGVDRLAAAHVLVAGVGGVGGACVEALGRAGVGRLTLVDFDRVAPSNCNRQVVALHSTVERLKVEVMAERLRDINPAIALTLVPERIAPAEAARHVPPGVDVVIDCIDAMISKVALLQAAQQAGAFAISSMGAGSRLNPAWVKVADLHDTNGCPLATAMRRFARRRGLARGVRAIYSDEPPMPHVARVYRVGEGPQKTVNGTISYMPAIFGYTAASEALRYLLGDLILPEHARGRAVPPAGREPFTLGKAWKGPDQARL